MDGIDDDVDEIALISLLYIQQQPNGYRKAIRMDQSFTEIERRINQAIDDAVYIVSLCTDHKNRLMWSYYADNHKGFWIEYEHCHECASNHFATPSALLLAMIPVVISFNSSIAFSSDSA